nr:MAG TPA: hypothetical protein [Caudoviricetes sp.]
MTDHPLTRAAAEITDTMVEAGASYAWEEANPGILGWNSISERHKEGCRRDARAVLTAALALAPAEDARPWEPLGESDLVRVGDEVKWDYYGLTMTATVARVDKAGSLYTAMGLHIGVRSVGTWYVRRPATPPAKEIELPGASCALTDVQFRGALAADLALWTGLEVVVVGFNGRAVVMRVRELVTFTLPDGTRGRRDGDHEDGTPRFVKEDSP